MAKVMVLEIKMELRKKCVLVSHICWVTGAGEDTNLKANCQMYFNAVFTFFKFKMMHPSTVQGFPDGCMRVQVQPQCPGPSPELP